MLATLDRVKAEFADVGLDPNLIDQGKLDRQLDKTLPKYAGVLASNGQDYDLLVLLDVCHWLAVPQLKWMGNGNGNGGQLVVMSASAGEVSVSYSAPPGVVATDPQTWTVWGQQLFGTGGPPKKGGLRSAQGPFASVGNGPPIRHR